MASIKVKYRPSSVEDYEGAIYYQIIHERKVRQIHTTYHIYKEEWDDGLSAVKVMPQSNRNYLLLSVREHIKWDIGRLAKIIRRLDEAGISYDSDEIVAEFKRYSVEYSLFNYMESVITRLRGNGKSSTAENYKSALVSFKRFREGEDIMLDNFTAGLVGDYEAWLKAKGVIPNTSSFYMRTLRAVYNRAVDDGMIVDAKPFRRVYTGVDKTRKRAISIDVVRRLKFLDLSIASRLRYARDMFLLSFCLRGMSFVDMAYLRRSDLKNGFVSYRRRKTGQLLRIEWTDEMQSILDSMEPSVTEYLLPVFNNCEITLRNRYKNTLRSINHNLKKLGEMIGLSIPLTMYVARHSWASAAKAQGIPVSVISEGMGHDSEATTRIYLAALETSVVDNANTLILNALQ